MRGWKDRREPRHKLLMRARMRAGVSDVDVCILDVSLRGALIQAFSPPPRGTFVEVHRDGFSFTGQVKWSKNRRCGIATRDRIDLHALVGPSSGGDASLSKSRAAKFKQERRPEEQLARSYTISRLLQFSATGAVAVAAAVIIGQVAYELLSNVAHAVASELGGTDQ